MCGICGIFTLNKNSTQPKYVAAVRRMTELMSRRGPDAEGFWNDPEEHLYLGFRRLAIIDLSQAGNQPMVSSDGRSVIVFNGEIYNFVELRNDLKNLGINFKSRSDTEVLLEALNYWGINAINRLNGMFAFVWYHIPTKTLTLARDHAGIKPLYYFLHPQKKCISFASQFNCLLLIPEEKGKMRLDVLHLYLRLHHIPPPYTLYENIHQLEAGYYLRIKKDGGIEKKCWWKLPANPQPRLKDKDADEALCESIQSTISRQSVADVPLGVFLSGGIDSPLVTAFLKERIGADLNAFTVSIPGWPQDESREAVRYAKSLGVKHHLYEVSEPDLIDMVKDALSSQYEPFGDFSIIPTLMISKLARGKIKVALSGDGGDELFFGYHRPTSLLRNGEDFKYSYIFRIFLYLLGKYHVNPPRSGAIIYKTPGDYYFDVNSRLKENFISKIAPGLPPMPTDFDLYNSGRYNGLKKMADFSRHAEFYGQLQRGLKKVDMASMHNGLEVRVPLLDKEIVEVSLTIDPFYCMKNGGRKYILKNLLSKFVAQDIITQEKRGFSIPLGVWLRGPLKKLAEEIIHNNNPALKSIINRRALLDYWEEHLTGKQDFKWGLWTLISLIWWSEENLNGGMFRE